MKSTLLGLALATGALAASPALAQEAGPQDAPLERDKVITAIDEATLSAAIAAVGGTTAPLDDEDNTVRIAYPNGMRGVARRMACEGTSGCKGLILLGYFTKPTDVSEARAQDALARFGFEQVISSVVVNREGEHVVKSYVMLDGGITQANLMNWIGLFGQSLAAYQGMLYGPTG
ncbi:MAG: hypothetical protein AAF291_04670 [Pseudomonadota bacterium]